MQGITEQRPIGELLTELAADTGTLVRKEVELAKVEIAGKAQIASRNALECGTGVAVLLLGGGSVLAGIILLLSMVIPSWLSALLVGVIVSAVGAVLLRRGVHSFHVANLIPHETVRTLGDTKQWARSEVMR